MSSVMRIFKWCKVCEKCTEHVLVESMKWTYYGTRDVVCTVCMEASDKWLDSIWSRSSVTNSD
jgi:hypothetical protein